MDFINTVEAASMLDRRPRTLERWRCAGIGPSFVRINGRQVRYQRRTVERWLREHTVIVPR